MTWKEKENWLEFARGSSYRESTVLCNQRFFTCHNSGPWSSKTWPAQHIAWHNFSFHSNFLLIVYEPPWNCAKLRMRHRFVLLLNRFFRQAQNEVGRSKFSNFSFQIPVNLYITRTYTEFIATQERDVSDLYIRYEIDKIVKRAHKAKTDLKHNLSTLNRLFPWQANPSSSTYFTRIILWKVREVQSWLQCSKSR